MQKDAKKFNDLNIPIDEFIKSCRMPAHVKYAETLEYALTNKQNLEIFGLSNDEELIGKDAVFLAKAMKGLWPHDYIGKINKTDLEVIKTKQMLITRVNNFVIKNGFIVDHTVTKIPLINTSQKVVGILTLVIDNTPKESLNVLRSRYLEQYKDRKKADNKLLEFMGFDKNICNHLTQDEADFIFTFEQDKMPNQITKKATLSSLKEKFGYSITEQFFNGLMQKLNGWRNRQF